MPDAATLDALTAASGGGVYTDASDLAPADGERIERDVPLRATFLWLALALFLADLILRRVRFA